ncbi:MULTISPECIES: polyhydroxyalkanoate synthesis repressor PhaR [Candidatus Ichthyocystis]|uniref:Polyhydroxyalkanoate synthesis repressor PhaR n=1 Tax=Candidatus Ichthyocystis hellenicum TaxID=1561003 RepID=A0A0S4M2G9_9BURK|nr:MULTISPECIES: polyhydroxyalkanoate synthesis repressor PhaR [Ichthyocystis]CUT17886.1 polyhydroxyalkanoate synthesis repressor PhaR [Candidatus Ichthyocystis hellenicum]
MSRLIKKYPNRRLYDTETSAYITLNDIKNLVVSSEEFVVIDVKKGDDITRSVLMQVLLEEENSNTPVFSAEFLKIMIRCYGHPMQGVFYSYLEKSIKEFFSSCSESEGGKPSDGHNMPSMSSDMSANEPNNMWPNFWGMPAFQDIINAYLSQTNVIFDQVKDQVGKMWGVPSGTTEDKADES